MKTVKLIFMALFLISLLNFESCGPVIISSRPSSPMPPWFYPSRVVNVRYIYFPDYMIYYDLTLRSYLYLDNGIWITANMLPQRFYGINMKKARQVQVRNYFDDNIRDYHSKNRTYNKSRRTNFRQ